MKNLPSNFYEFYKDKKTKNLLHLREDINEDEKEWLKDEGLDIPLFIFKFFLFRKVENHFESVSRFSRDFQGNSQ